MVAKSLVAAVVAAAVCMVGCNGTAAWKRSHRDHQDKRTSMFDNAPESARSKVCVCHDSKGVKACPADAGPLACAELARDHGGSGWAELRISTFSGRGTVPAEAVAEAVGFAEGMATAAEISELRARFTGGSIRSAEDQATVLEFAKQQWPAVEHAASTAMARIRAGKAPEGSESPPAIGKALAGRATAYWTAVSMSVHQMRGLARGYRHAHNAAAASPSGNAESFLNAASGVWGPLSEQEAFWAIVALNYDVDAFDITDAAAGGGGFGSSSDAGSAGEPSDLGGGRFSALRGPMTAEESAALAEREEAQFTAESWALRSSRGRCTAAIVATQSCLGGGTKDSKCDVFATHATWGHYGEAIRVYKTVDWAGVESALGDKPPPRLSYSSYPGMISSTDDWLVLGSGILVTETTIGAAAPSAIGRLTTTTPEFATPSPPASASVPVQPLPAFLRSIVASLTAASAAEWTRLFAARNGGTSNSQWLLVDYNSPAIHGGAHSGLVWVLEQTPKRVLAADVTRVFLGKARGLWPGTNRPVFAPARDDLGYPGEVGRGPLVRAAASAMGVRVGAPAGVSGEGERAGDWGMTGLWELRAGTRETDVEQEGSAARFAAAKHAGHPEHPAPRAGDGSSLLWDGSESDVGLDLDTTALSRFRQMFSSSASSSGAAPGASEPSSLRGGLSDAPWLDFGRQRHRHHHRPAAALGPVPAGSSIPAGIRFAAVSSEVSSASTSTYALARQHAARLQLHRSLAATPPDAASATGYTQDTSSGVGYYSFDSNPRAAQLQQFARSATSLDSALRVPRMNGWPMVQATHRRPYFAPAARFDLAAASDASLQPFGAIDGKAVSVASMAKGEAAVVAGPSRGFGWRSAAGGVADSQQPLLEAFDWRTFGSEGVCGQEPNPAMLDGDTVLSGTGAGDRKCACGPAWAVHALQLPCGLGLDEQEMLLNDTVVPRVITVGGAIH